MITTFTDFCISARSGISTVGKLGAWVVAVSCLLLAGSASAAKPQISIDDKGVRASVTPGASCAFFMLAQENNPRELRVIDGAQILADDDRDGVVRMDLAAPAPFAVVVAVDLSTGDYDITTPAGIKQRHRPLQQEAVHGRSEAGRANVAFKGSYAIIWLARPGVGAWASTVMDSGPSDGDGRLNGEVAILTDTLKPIGPTPAAPTDFQRGDVVIVGDPLHLHIYDQRVAK